MTNERLAECLRIIGWSTSEFCRRLDLRERTAREWLNGQRPIPDHIADWVEATVKHMQAGPKPPER
jgi:hypothetical protein